MANDRELIGIQMLRGLCATAVVVDHAGGMLADAKYGGFALPDALKYGAAGVDIFFVISAFIIPLVSLRGAGFAPRISTASFVGRRVARILPLMWVAILSYAAMQLAFTHAAIDWAGYARALFLWPDSYLLPNVIWTLRQEFAFYLIFCLSFFGPKAFRILILAWIVSPIVYVWSLGSLWKTTAFIDTTSSILFSTVNIEFACGLAVGLFFVRHPQRATIASPVHPFVVISLAVLASLSLGWLLGLEGQTLPTTALMGLCGAVIVWGAARLACPEGWLTRLGKALGDASYSIYLFHSHVLAAVLALRVKLHINAPGPVVLVGVVILSLVAGILISIWIERPLVRMAKSLLARRSGDPAPVTP